MKNFRTAAILFPTLLVTLAACGSSTTTSDSAPGDTTPDSSVEVITTDTGPATIVTTPAITTPPTTNPPSTSPPATNPPATSPPATTPDSKKPKFNSFSVSAATPCFPEVANYPYPNLTVTWDVSGATSVYVAIDNEFGPWEQNLPAAGSSEVPPPGCPSPGTGPDDVQDTQTYYVVAENEFGRTVMQETRS